MKSLLTVPSALLLLLALSAGPAVAVPSPTDLPLGEDPEVAWQSGTAVHLPNGKTVSLRLGRGSEHDEVLGKRGGEWLVVIPGWDAKVLAVSATKVRTVWKHVYDESATSYTASEGGSLVVEWNYTRSGSTEATVFDLRGKVVARRSWPNTEYLLDFVGDTLLISGKKASQTWTVPGKPVPAGPGGYAGDLEQDLIFVTLPHDVVGPTSLSSPATPAWTSDSFIPELISPDGQYVAGRTFKRTLKLEVRRMSDGAVVPLPAYHLPFDSAMTWESSGALLVELRTGGGRVLVRCTTAGACEQATKAVKGQEIGFPS